MTAQLTILFLTSALALATRLLNQPCPLYLQLKTDQIMNWQCVSYQALEPTLPFVFTTQNWSNYEQAITTDADLSSADQLRPVRISLFPHLHTPFSPSLKSLMVSVEIKHHIYLLFDQQADLYIAFEFQFSLTRVEYLISHHEYGSWPWHSTKGHWNCPCTCNAQWLLFQLT